jgi:hypothetical protein
MYDFEKELEEACRKANDDSQSFKLGWVSGTLRRTVAENVAQKKELEKLRELHKQASAK